MRCWLVLLLLGGTASAGSAPDLALARGKALATTEPLAAVAVLDELVAHFPGSARAPEAAMLALDTLNREQRFDDLLVHVHSFMDNRLLVRHRAFARDLRRIYLRCCMRRFTSPPHVDYEREALNRLEDFASDPSGAYSDELLYEAGWQFCISNHPDAAERAWHALLAIFPRSELVVRARVGLGDLGACRPLSASR